MITQNLRFFALALAAICICQTSAQDGSEGTFVCQESQCFQSPSVKATVVEANDDAVVIRVTVDELGQPVPILNSIPYVSRMFKNTGACSTTRTAVVRIPRSQIDTAKTNNSTAQCTTQVAEEPADGCSSLGSFATNFEVVITGNSSNGCPEGPCSGPAQHLTAVQSCPFTSGSTCDSTCGSTRQAAKTTGTAQDQACCSACGAKKVTTTHNFHLHEQLVKALTENAQLKAKEEVRREFAEQRERLFHEMVEARVEVAKLQSQLESRRPQIVSHFPPTEVASPPHHPYAATVKAVARQVEQLKAENDALKARVAKLQQQVNPQRKMIELPGPNARPQRCLSQRCGLFVF